MAGNDHEHDHDHGAVQFAGAEISDDQLAALRATHAPLADCLDLTRRWSALTDDEKKRAAELQSAVEKHLGWVPGYHAEGDRCATCGKPTTALFVDRFETGALPYAAFLAGLPVHADAACLEGFMATPRDTSPRGLDKARRGLMRDLERPSPKMSQFFRHDVLAHPPFGLEDWAHSVADAQAHGLDKSAMKDLERLIRWVHHRLFH